MSRVRARGPSVRAPRAGVAQLFSPYSFPACAVICLLWAARKPPRARRRKNRRNALNLTLNRRGSINVSDQKHFDFISQSIEVIFVKYTAVFYVRVFIRVEIEYFIYRVGDEFAEVSNRFSFTGLSVCLSGHLILQRAGICYLHFCYVTYVYDDNPCVFMSLYLS